MSINAIWSAAGSSGVRPASATSMPSGDRVQLTHVAEGEHARSAKLVFAPGW